MAKRPNLIALFILLAWMLAPTVVVAADERYGYDGQGRLILRLDDSGQATHYRYDPVGNLLEVTAPVDAAPPTLETVPPVALRGGTTTAVRVTGSGLPGVRITTSHSGIHISALQQQDGALAFTLTLDPDLPPGVYTITFTTAAGSVTHEIVVQPTLPEWMVTPALLAIPPNGAPSAFLLRLSHADMVEHTFTLAVADDAMATLSSDTLTIPAGETEANGQIIGLAAGLTQLLISAPSWGERALPVFITPQFAGANSSLSPVLGVERPVTPPPGSLSSTLGPVVSGPTGVVVGQAVTGLSPEFMSTGGGGQSLTILGNQLATVDNVSLLPADGITLGAPVVAADGSSLTVPVMVAADAPLGMRQVLVRNGDALVPASTPLADRLSIVPPPPVVESLTPYYAYPGDSGVTLTIRGRNFQGFQSVTLINGDGVTVTGIPQVSDDGTRITVTLDVDPGAALGEAVVVVNATGGSSDPTPGPNNTFHVVLEVAGTYPHLMALPVGVVRGQGGDDAGTPAPPRFLPGGPVGVLFGMGITGISPANVYVGREWQLTINGSGLEAATEVRFLPGDGITLNGTPTAASDGTRLSVPIQVAADAPFQPHQVQVWAGAVQLPLTGADNGVLGVTAPPPVVTSVAPLFVEVGSVNVPVTVRGINLQRVEALQMIPADGITVAGITGNSAGDRVDAVLTVAADAATGPRMMRIVTAGGSSSDTPDITNTVALVPQGGVGATYAPIIGPPLGVAWEGGSDPQIPSQTLFQLSRPLGVMIPETVPPEEPVSATLLQRVPVGVTLGPVITAITPRGVTPGESVTVTVSGHHLQGVTGLAIAPAEGVTVMEDLTVAADGRSLTVTVATDATAASGWRSIQVTNASGEVPYAEAGVESFYLNEGAPVILSIEPILAARGDRVSLLIRGSTLAGVEQVTVTPAAGITVLERPTVNAEGTEARVALQVAADAPLGARVVQVVVPGAASSPDPAPANTFTVYETIPR